MITTVAQSKKSLAGLFLALMMWVGAGNAFAHCDTLDGPVVKDGREALAVREVTPVLKWVSKDEEPNIEAVFKHTLAVRQLGDEASDLAEAYFLETLVRIHRQGEGAPYTGLKPAGEVDPAVALADEALAKGSVDRLSSVLANALKVGLSEKFDAVYAASQQADQSVEKGREYVEAYVLYTHFVEGIHNIIQGGVKHAEHN